MFVLAFGPCRMYMAGVRARVVSLRIACSRIVIGWADIRQWEYAMIIGRMGVDLSSCILVTGNVRFGPCVEDA